MPGPYFYDRVQETSTTTGTGTLTLGGAVSGYRAFSTIGDGNTCYYCVTDGVNWEVGQGTYTLSGTTLSRDTIFASSNAGALVSFPAGTKFVFNDASGSFFTSVAQICTQPLQDVRILPNSTTVLYGSDPFVIASGQLLDIQSGALLFFDAREDDIYSGMSNGRPAADVYIPDNFMLNVAGPFIIDAGRLVVISGPLSPDSAGGLLNIC